MSSHDLLTNTLITFIMRGDAESAARAAVSAARRRSLLLGDETVTRQEGERPLNQCQGRRAFWLLRFLPVSPSIPWILMKVEGETVTLVRRGQGTKGDKRKMLLEEAELGLSRGQGPAELRGHTGYRFASHDSGRSSALLSGSPHK